MIAQGKQRNSTRVSGCASLSVIIVSSGSPIVSQRAAQVIRRASRDFAAQLIVVSQDASCATTVETGGAEFVMAPAGSTRAEMCDLGMSHASGAIIAVRDDAAVGDAGFLEAFRAILPRREPASIPVETVIVDTMVAGAATLADAVASFATRDKTARTVTIGTVAAL
jgi:hypothetical protein